MRRTRLTILESCEINENELSGCEELKNFLVSSYKKQFWKFRFDNPKKEAFRYLRDNADLCNADLAVISNKGICINEEGILSYIIEGKFYTFNVGGATLAKEGLRGELEEFHQASEHWISIVPTHIFSDVYPLFRGIMYGELDNKKYIVNENGRALSPGFTDIGLNEDGNLYGMREGNIYLLDSNYQPAIEISPG